MKVLLLEDVWNLGKAGEVVDVSEDYARKELFPKERASLAVPEDNGTSPAAATDMTRISQEEFERAQQRAELLDQNTVRIERPLDPQGTFHSPVTAVDIAVAIEDAFQVSIPADAVKLQAPITEAGHSVVTLELPHGLEAEVKVIAEGTERKTDGTAS